MSIEYIVILAIVLVITLALAYLIAESSAPTSEIIEKQSLGYWIKTMPFSIVDYKASGYTLTTTIVNRDPQTVTLTGIYVNGVLMYGVPTTFLSKQERTLTFNTGVNCVDEFSYTLRFTYNAGTLNGITQQGERPLVGTCA